MAKTTKNRLTVDFEADSESGEEEIESGGEDEAVDGAAHEKLLNSIFAMDGKKRNQNDVRGISMPSGNLDAAVHAKKEEGKIKPQDLNLKRKDTTGNLMKPMNSMETELAKRKVARDSMNAEMTTWEPVVQEIRSAPQMIFSKRPHGIEMYNAMKPKAFTPRTPLEKELYKALGQSEDVLHPRKELTKAEEKALKAMSIQEAMERRAELLKHNELLSRAQIRAKRMGKIKSKRYRKILRKEREGAEKKELEKLRATDPEAFIEKMEQLEKDRMEERLTLKHRGGGKFARLHKVYSKFDDKTRDAMQDMLQKSRELTKKTATVSSSDDDEEERGVDMEVSSLQQAAAGVNETNQSSKAEDAQTRMTRLEMLKAINKKAGGWLDGPKSTFVYVDGKTSSKSSDKEEPLEAAQDAGDEQNGTGASETNSEKNVNPESSSLKADSGNSQELPTESTAVSRAGKRKAVEDEDDEGEEEDVEKGAEESVPEPKKKKRKRNKKKKTEEGEATESATPKQKPVVETTLSVPDLKSGDNEEDDEDDDGDNDDAMKVTMEELFQDEDVVEEFAREKAAAEERARPKIEDMTLPGWGSWAGPDYKTKEKPLTKKQKRALARAELLQKQQKKVQQPHVWINPNKDEAIRKLQPKGVPFPYTSVQQYEASLRQPVSRGFVTETAYKLLNKPEVVTKLGHIIKPLDKEDVFKQKSARDDGAMGPVKPVGGVRKKVGEVSNRMGGRSQNSAEVKGKDSFVAKYKGKVSINKPQRRKGIS